MVQEAVGVIISCGLNYLVYDHNDTEFISETQRCLDYLYAAWYVLGSFLWRLSLPIRLDEIKLLAMGMALRLM